MHRRRRGRAAVLLEPQLLAQNTRDRHPAIHFGSRTPPQYRKSPGLLQLPLLPPGAAQFLASRLEMDGVVSSMLAALLRSAAQPLHLPSFHGPSIAAGTFDSLRLFGALPRSVRPSHSMGQPRASGSCGPKVRAAETLSRDAFSAAVERLLQQQ
jgi:hypothetical protein